MANDERKLLSLIENAQKNPDDADILIRDYMPFIKTQTAKFIKRIPREDDDELSIAMFAFYEAAMHYNPAKGTFLKLAERTIKNRLIDYYRKEQRHTGIISLDNTVGDDERETVIDKIPDKKDKIEEMEQQMAAGSEIQHFSEQLQEFGISLTEVARACPKQERTLQLCMQVLQYARKNEEVLNQLVQSKKLPIQQLSQGAGVQRKTLERHRKYLVAILLAYTNGFEIIRGHLSQVKREEETR